MNTSCSGHEHEPIGRAVEGKDAVDEVEENGGNDNHRQRRDFDLSATNEHVLFGEGNEAEMKVDDDDVEADQKNDDEEEDDVILAHDSAEKGARSRDARHLEEEPRQKQQPDGDKTLQDDVHVEVRFCVNHIF